MPALQFAPETTPAVTSVENVSGTAGVTFVESRDRVKVTVNVDANVQLDQLEILGGASEIAAHPEPLSWRVRGSLRTAELELQPGDIPEDCVLVVTPIIAHEG